MNSSAPRNAKPANAPLAWVDHLKALGIVAVVLGHTKLPPKVLFAIYTFHMPLFFLLSGYLWNEKIMQGPWREIWHRKARHLVSYFLFFGLIGAIYRVGETALLGGAESPLQSARTSLIALAYGSGSREPLPSVFPVSLWFFPALITGSLLIPFFLRWRSVLVSILGILVFFALGYWTKHEALPWELEGGFVAAALIGIGYLLRRWSPGSLARGPRIAASLLLLGVGTFLALNAGGKNNFRVSEFHCWPLSLGGAVLLTAGLAGIASLLPASRLSSRLAAASITIFPLHGILFRVVDKGLEHRFGPNTNWLETKTLYCLGLGAFSLALLTWLHPLIDSRLKVWFGAKAK